MSVIKSHYHSTKRDDGFSTSSFVASLYNAAHTMERSSVSAGIDVSHEIMALLTCNDPHYGAATKTQMLNSIDPNIINYKKKYILLVVFHVLDCLNYDHSWRFN